MAFFIVGWCGSRPANEDGRISGYEWRECKPASAIVIHKEKQPIVPVVSSAITDC